VPLTATAACIFWALFVLGMLALGAIRPDNRVRRAAEQIERYGMRHVPVATGGPVARFASRRVAPLLKFRDIGPHLAARLDLAGIGRTPAEWVLISGCVSAALAFAVTVLFGNALVAIVVGGLAGWQGMRFALSFLIKRHRARFGTQLPDVLQFIAGSLRSGFSLGQGLDAVVREDTQPAASEFARALAAARVGVELEDALDTVADRMESADLRWTVIAIRIQREVGGNLAEVLANTVVTMRERASLYRHVKALSAEGKLSAYLLVSLPLGIFGWLFITSRPYVRPLYTTPVGIGMLVFFVVMIVSGSLWMRKLIKVEV
jgi:Flp pilus assembly protein TadB